MDANRWQRMLLWSGLAGLVLGAIDPLEGSVVILAACVVATAGAYIGHLATRRWLVWAVALLAIGVGGMVALSAIGGIGGTSGRSKWWALTLLPYPVGWILALSGTVKAIRAGGSGGDLRASE